MKLKYDLHTHTVFSHGKGTIEENVRAAVAAGLQAVGISDHGPGHLTYGVRRSDFAVMRAEIDRLRESYPQIEILLGVEANIIDPSGKLDISAEEEKLFDYVNAGYHYGVFGPKPFFAAGVHLANLAWEASHSVGVEKKRSRKRPGMIRTINTELAIEAIYENRIKVLTHPGAKADVCIDEIAKACAERGTLLELNDGHGYLTAEGIREAASADVSFIIGSDAHRPDRIGHCGRALRIAAEAGLDLSRIVNLEV